MSRVASLLLLCAVSVAIPTALLAQNTSQPSNQPADPSGMQPAGATGLQSGMQRGAQTGVQGGIQTTAPSSNGAPPKHTFIPMPNPMPSPGQIELLKLETAFSQAVTKGGGRAFSSWFADDGVTLNNGRPAVLGRSAITSIATWDPKAYQLSWYVEGAQMGPSDDAGFTWGHYDAVTVDKDGKSITTSGRYITFWKKVAGKWKVALDASANEPPEPPTPAPATTPAPAP